jgi:hypothetical protein
MSKNINLNKDVSEPFLAGYRYETRNCEHCFPSYCITPPDELSAESIVTKIDRRIVISQDSGFIVKNTNHGPVKVRDLKAQPYYLYFHKGTQYPDLTSRVQISNYSCKGPLPWRGAWQPGGYQKLTFVLGVHTPQPSLPSHEMPVTAVAYEEAVNGFYKDTSQLRVNLAVAYRERKQTIDLVAGTASKIYRALRYMKRGQLSRATSVLGFPGRKVKTRKALADQWLELQYGWGPLLQDVYGAMVLTVPRPLRIPVYIMRKHSFDHYGIQNGWATNARYHDRVTIKAIASPTGDVFNNLTELGLDNPALFAWESVPFSFVADWFYPIGDWLQAQTALVGLDLQDINITKTRKILYNRDKKLIPTYHPNDKLVLGNFNGFIKTKRRIVGVTPHIIPPRFKNPYSVHHALSAIALLSNFFGNTRNR